MRVKTRTYEMVYHCDQGDFSSTSYAEAVAHEESLSVHHVTGRVEDTSERSR